MQDNTEPKTYRTLLSQRQGQGFSEDDVTNILQQVLPQLENFHNQGTSHGAISLDTLGEKNDQVYLFPPTTLSNTSTISQDIYDLGLVVIELLRAKTSDKLHSIDGTWNWQDNCLVSDQLTQVINRMIATSPQERFKEAKQVLQALNFSEFAPAVEIATSVDPHRETKKSRSASKPWVLIGIGSLFLVGLAGLAFWKLTNINTPNPTSATNPSTPAQSVNPAIPEQALFPIKNDGSWGYIDQTGQNAIKPQFDEAKEFSDGLSLVRIGNKWGYINKTGKFAINPQFDEATEFSDGLSLVRIGNKWGYIDKTGKFVINPQFDVAGSFSEGLAPIRSGNKWGYIDKTGNFVIKPQFDEIANFTEGLALVKTGKKYGYIDNTGKFVIKPQFDGAKYFREGLAPARQGNNWGYIDKTGNFVINPQFEEPSHFSNDLAAVKIGGKWGYVDKMGQYVINPQFGFGREFSEGIAPVLTGNKWGYIDKTGKYVINPQFDGAGNFREGLAAVVAGNKWGYIDKNGQYVGAPTNDNQTATVPTPSTTPEPTSSPLPVAPQSTLKLPIYAQNLLPLGQVNYYEKDFRKRVSYIRQGNDMIGAMYDSQNLQQVTCFAATIKENRVDVEWWGNLTPLGIRYQRAKRNYSLSDFTVSNTSFQNGLDNSLAVEHCQSTRNNY